MPPWPESANSRPEFMPRQWPRCGSGCKSALRKLDSHLYFCLLLCFAWAAPIKVPLSGSKCTGSRGRSANKRRTQVCMHLFLTRTMFTYGYDAQFFSSLPYFHSWVSTSMPASRKTRLRDDVSASSPEAAASKNTACWWNWRAFRVRTFYTVDAAEKVDHCEV